MKRTKLILPPPGASASHHRDLAMGIHGVWACALHAAGADVFAPLHPLDPDADPHVALAGACGAALMHDGAPLDSTIDVIVFAELRCGDDGWRCRARIVRPDGAETVLPGRAHRSARGVLDAMTATLHAIAGALGLPLPEEIGWQRLLGARTVAAAIEALRAEGRQALQHAGLEPAATVH
jgi:hypothetical protein